MDPQVELENLERELAKTAQACNQDGLDAEPTIQKLIGANQNILERIKQLQ